VKELDMRKSHVMARVRHVIPDVCFMGILRLVLVVLVDGKGSRLGATVDVMTDITVIRRRLYITGLTSNISSDHIRDRFSSFGTVRDVDELQPDALGLSSSLDDLNLY
jgi:hypothetical protein